MRLDEIRKYIIEEWAVISGSPASFIIAVLAITFIIWLGLEWRFNAIISNKDSEITLYKAQRDDYREKLGGATPSEAKDKINSLEGRVRQIEAQLVDYTKKLGGATADEAKARIDALEERVKQIEPLRKEMELLIKQMANIEKLGGATPDKTKTRIAELEDRLRNLEPRRLTPQQHNILTEKARLPLGTTYIIVIVYDGACADCSQYASDIVTALQKASNWDIREGTVLGPRQKSSKGLTIILPDHKHPSSEASLLIQALKAAELQFDLVSGRPSGDTQMEILVTAKIILQ